MRTSIVLTAALLVVSGALTGCGLKGDLYLPEEQTGTVQTEAPEDNAPAAASDPALETSPTP